jgi:hypothetical protein
MWLLPTIMWSHFWNTRWLCYYGPYLWHKCCKSRLSVINPTLWAMVLSVKFWFQLLYNLMHLKFILYMHKNTEDTLMNNIHSELRFFISYIFFSYVTAVIPINLLLYIHAFSQWLFSKCRQISAHFQRFKILIFLEYTNKRNKSHHSHICYVK